jgi:putative ABC transport system permease protein
MMWLPAYARRLLTLFRRDRLEDDLADELGFHLEMEIEANRRAGMPEVEARRAALVRLGGLEQTKILYREQRGLPWLEAFVQDLRHAVRSLARTPGYAAVAILSLAIGIGGTTAIFSVVDGVLLRPLPYPKPDRLVRVFTQSKRRARNPNSEANFLDYRSGIASLQSVGAFNFARYHLDVGGEPRRILVARVSHELLPLVGVAPALGRTFTPAEDAPGGGDVVVLGHALWQEAFGGSPDAIGAPIRLQGRAFTVVGVMPAGFRFPDRGVVAWVPLALDPANPYARVNHYLGVIGRLGDRATFAGAKAELEAYGRRVVALFPENYRTFAFGVTARRLYEDTVGDTRTALLMLLGAVVCVLLIACANVAHLLLVRAEARARDIAVRRALGASSGRIAAGLVAEGLVVAVAGGLLGLAVAFAARRALVVTGAGMLPRVDEIAIDGRVLAFTMGVSLATGVLVGWLPAFRSARTGLQDALRQGGYGATSSPAAGRVRRVLVGAEVAVAVVLVAGAGLLVRSFANLQRVDVGFRTDNVLTLRVDPPPDHHESPESIVAFHEAIENAVARLPGVRAAGWARAIPLANTLGWTSIQLEGREVEQIGDAPVARIQQVTPGYFDVLGLRIVAGRVPAQADVAANAGVAVVNETFARQMFRNEPAIGRHVRMFDRRLPWMEIVGVVRDVRAEGLQEPAGARLYVAHAQAERFAYEVDRDLSLLLSADTDVARLAAPVRQLIRDVNRGTVVRDVRTMAEIRFDAAADRELPTVLLAMFGGVALFLAAIGIYGVVAYSVGRRMHEIGVRMAFGATAATVRRMVVRQALVPVVLGLAAGLAAAVGASAALESLLFEVGPADRATLAGVAVVVVAVTLAASYLPARRASALDVSTVLRAE